MRNTETGDVYTLYRMNDYKQNSQSWVHQSGWKSFWKEHCHGCPRKTQEFDISSYWLAMKTRRIL